MAGQYSLHEAVKTALHPCLTEYPTFSGAALQTEAVQPSFLSNAEQLESAAAGRRAKQYLMPVAVCSQQAASEQQPASRDIPGPSPHGMLHTLAAVNQALCISGADAHRLILAEAANEAETLQLE